MSGLARWWNAYWFKPAPLFDLGVCRLLIVGFQLFYLLTTPYHERFLELSRLPDALYDPLPVLHLLIWPAGWDWRPTVGALQAIYWATLAAGAFAFAGWKTTPALALFTAGNLLMDAFKYSFGEFHHPQAAMMIGLAALAAGGCGRAVSLDALLARVREAARGRRPVWSRPLEETADDARWPLLLMQWLFAMIYLSAAATKWANAGIHWLNGYTLQYYLVQDGLRWDRTVGLWLGKNHALALALSWATFLWEGLFFLVLIVPRLALLFVPLGIAMHAGMFVAMKANFFQYVALYAVFVPWSRVAAAVSRWWERAAGRPALVLYDANCPLCVRTMTLFSAVDWFGRLRFADLEQGRSAAARPPSAEECRREIHAVLPDGSTAKGFFAFRRMIAQLPPLWPLLPLFYLPLAPTVGPRLYARIAGRRGRFDGCPLPVQP